VGPVLEELGPIDDPLLEDRRRAWVAAFALSRAASPQEAANLRSVISAATRAGEDGEPDLGLELLQLSTARSYWLDPGPAIPAKIGAAGRSLAPHPSDARSLFIRAIAPEGHVDDVLAHLSDRARSGEPISAMDGRLLGTAALWVGALDQCVDFYTG